CARMLVSAEKGDVVINVDSNNKIDTDGDSVELSITEEEGHVVAEIVERCMFGRVAVFFDRDDTINDDVGRCRLPDDIRIFPFVGSALKKLNDRNILTIMVTNQSVIGRGQLDDKGLEMIHRKVIDDCFPGRIDDIFYCPHLPNAECDCRKPKVGMAIEALKKYNINTFRSYMVGDSDNDILFGNAIGCKSYKVSAEYTFSDAVNDILLDMDNQNTL
ncbi:MAG: HAD-IIIA family hydrolase, partial [archaeon]|nr:HAD-IIIA family hydrolase [archaeon]